MVPGWDLMVSQLTSPVGCDSEQLTVPLEAWSLANIWLVVLLDLLLEPAVARIGSPPTLSLASMPSGGPVAKLPARIPSSSTFSANQGPVAIARPAAMNPSRNLRAKRQLGDCARLVGRWMH